MSNPQEFARQYGSLAAQTGQRLGVDPNILLGQWGLETGWGRSVIPGTNNLGNIKDFSGAGVAATDNMTGSRDRYRAYQDPSAFGNDFASLIERRYKPAVGVGNDPQAWATALQSGGYAEDPDYVRKVVAATDLVRRSGGLMDQAAQAVLPSAQAAEPKQPLPWKEVIQRPSFQALSPQEQTEAQEQYFDEVVVPRLASDEVEDARNQFFGQYPPPYMRLEMSHEGAPEPVSENPAVGLGAGIGAGVGTVALNAQRYLGQGIRGLGADRVGNWLVNDAERGLQNLQSQLEPYRQVSPFSAGAGELLGNVAATLPVGGILASGVRAAAPTLGAASPAAMRTAEALRTWGMQTGAAPATLAGRAGNMALRAGAGGATGVTAGALVSPEDAQTAGIVGAAFPVAATAIGRGAQALGRSLSGGEVSQPVRNLVARAEELGIRIPADRIADSRPLNAISSSLNYVPFSGRAATEARMQSDLNRAVSRTFGQESENVTQALRQASDDLGAKFDSVLRNTAVRVDDQLLDDLARAESQALQELPEPQARVIVNQINEILKQGGAGQIEGQLAYNIKRTLDRIAKRNSPEGWYANELRKTLMDALNRSLGPDEAAKFATTRRQYGNMLSLEQLAQNGVEGDISIARLANMRNIRNPELQEIADIAAQFLRPREGQHGAAQRVLALGLTGMAGGPAAAVASVGAGRLANTMLNSQAARNALMGNQSNTALANALRQALPASYRTAPVISAQ